MTFGPRGCESRKESPTPFVFSILITSAPKSASKPDVYGPDITSHTSTTRTFFNGPGSFVLPFHILEEDGDVLAVIKILKKIVDKIFFFNKTRVYGMNAFPTQNL